MKRRTFLQSAAGATLFTILPRRLVAGSGQTPRCAPKKSTSKVIGVPSGFSYFCSGSKASPSVSVEMTPVFCAGRIS